MTSQLTQKEKMYLNDQKSYEQMCVQKYSSYAAQAQDPQLKQLFNGLAGSEQQHFNTINQMLSGQVPAMNQGQSQQQGAASQTSSGAGQSAASQNASDFQNSATQGTSSQSGSSSQGSAASSQSGASTLGNAMSSQSGSTAGRSNTANSQSGNSAGSNDAMLCQDMLMTEKHISGAYDTAIFEFSNADMRQALNHIQKEEQQHGEQIFNYMQNNGMYNVQS